MGRIQRLPPDLANQIAAGEVVERPASVIKELVENAIDAGARRLSIAVELGGKKLIRVDDDGEGMDPEDARLAVERHATSKIRRADDLAAIATLGFRGEALPAIASVSHFVMRTRTRQMDAGTEIRVNGGAIASVAEAGMPEGTSIEVADLFYNLPARRKFLKSDGAESAQISRLVSQLALCYPEVGFTLTSAGRKVLQCPPVSSLRERLYQLYGDRSDLIEVRRDAGDVKVLGYIAALAEQGPTRGPQNLFVNRRIVKDRTVAHAVIDAYSRASIKERSPEMHLFIEMPHDAVDVNVHPTKAEVRFRDQSYIHELVRRTLGDALGRGPAPELQLEAPRGLTPQPSTLPLPNTYASVYPSRWAAPISGSAFAPNSGSGIAPTSGGIAPTSGSPFAPTSESAFAPTTESGLAPTIRPMMALGQFRDTFIIAVDEEGIAIVDQHVAHERVLFERITERLTSGRLESQRLLEPMLVELPPSSRQVLVSRAADLERLGFEIEEFGGDAVRVAAFPVLLRREECPTALRALAEDLETAGTTATVDEAIKKIAATMACHAAVKANDPLTPEKMAHILDELRRTSVLDDLSPRPAGDVEADAPRSRKELSTHIIRRMSMRQAIVVFVALAGGQVLAQQAAPPGLPPLFFREEWKQIDRPANAPADFVPEGGVTPAAVTNANLELRLYDPNGRSVPAYLKQPPTGSIARDWGGPSCIQLAGYNQNPPPATVAAGQRTDPPNLWTGVCQTPVAATLRDKGNFVDLTGLARIRWVTRVSGFHVVRPLVKLADGTWLVGDYGEGAPSSNSTLFLQSEFAIANVRWLTLDIARVVTRGQSYVEKPDLSKVDEIGFADLLPGSGHGWGGFVNVARFEVFGRPVKR